MNSSGDIVISIKSKYVDRIIAGEKLAELRRRAPQIAPGCRIWIYKTAPHATIAIMATVDAVATGSPSEIWERYEEVCGVSHEEFTQYFAEAKQACAILLRDVKEISPQLSLREIRKKSRSFQPPQFFKRLHDGSPELELFRSRHLAELGPG